MKLRRCWSRRALMASSSVGPSAPQFHERLSVVPSLLSSPLASLCLSLYETRSREREPVVGGEEVDAGERAAAVFLVEVGRAGDAVGELAQALFLTAPEVAHAVAVLAVPLLPLGGEVADLVAALADVPRLGDQLDLADDRVLLDEIEERRQPIDVVQPAGQRRGEVEAEAVDVHLGHPVAQAVHHELQRVRVPHVQAVAGAGVVEVVELVAVDQAVVGGVVEALHRQRGTEVVALGRVVVDDVEDHLDPGGVEVLHHLAELLHLLAGLAPGVVVVRREEPDRVVAPVVAQTLLDEVAVVDELVHRQQLDRGDAEVVQMLDERRVGEAAVACPAARARRRGGGRWRPSRAPRRSPTPRPARATGGRSPSRSTG